MRFKAISFKQFSFFSPVRILLLLLSPSEHKNHPPPISSPLGSHHQPSESLPFTLIGQHHLLPRFFFLATTSIAPATLERRPTQFQQSAPPTIAGKGSTFIKAIEVSPSLLPLLYFGQYHYHDHLILSLSRLLF